ncbi:hypothetical protein [Caenimonas aquaedulcis]|uniref:Uncharacterized protein n=1 Tax=Caenimonas aquaedulcis TaxID=2793270 RepID=A0A931H6F4_9BURK|nr:hypothetical protein [Caenimonas aquaedulcis]MBG9389288.1 hypothetical protein [Caenimonas aquaedulcis]
MAEPSPHLARPAAAAPARAPTPPLLRLAADGARPGQVADAAVREWNYVHGALSPLIGQRGAASLFRRVLHLARADRPWLDAAYLGNSGPGDFASFHAALSRQESLIAAGAHDEMLRALRGLLANLIGLSLTDRLLPATSSSPSAGPAVQDASP